MENISKRKKLLFYLILFVFVYLSVECLSFIFYFATKKKLFSFSQYQTHRIFIRNSPIFKNSPDSPGVLKRGDNYRGDAYEVIHPYLGFVHDPSKMQGHSQYGFPDDPFNISTNDNLIIGLFGGSFAEQTSLMDMGTFKDTLQKMPVFKNKKIIILTLAMVGYKQPQQLFALLYFLFLGAHFDMVINLDGFNEVALAPAENIPKNVSPFYPRSWFMRVRNFTDAEMLGILGEISLLHKKQQKWADLFSTKPLRYSIFANLIWWYYNKMIINEKTVKEIVLQQYKISQENNISYIATGPSFDYKNDSDLYGFLADIWMKCSIQMNKICMANGIEYYHFLQPNQYVADSKIMTQEERNIALNDNSTYKEGAEKGYPYLIKAGEKMTQSGVNFHDLTMIFADNDQILYKDDCCHLNEKGYSIIGTAIGKIIVGQNRNKKR